MLISVLLENGINSTNSAFRAEEGEEGKGSFIQQGAESL